MSKEEFWEEVKTHKRKRKGGKRKTVQVKMYKRRVKKRDENQK